MILHQFSYIRRASDVRKVGVLLDQIPFIKSFIYGLLQIATRFIYLVLPQ